MSAVVLAFLAWAPRLDAQAASPRTARFLDEARDGTRRYESQANAIADGFRRVGVELPEMGEHWISVRRVLEDTLAPTRPSVLIYVNVGGEPRLAGVGYTALLGPGEEPPDFEPARGFWHDHNGSIADESLPLSHHRPDGATPVGDRREPPVRLSVLHAWIWTPNADGVFATQNWSLPSLRVGANGPLVLPRDATRALALASDAAGYYELMVRTQTADAGKLLTPAEERAVADALADHRARAADEAASLKGARSVPHGVAEQLAATWRSLWSTLERALPAHATQLRELRQRL